MADQFVECSECGAKLKLKAGYRLTKDTPCPKCGENQSLRRIESPQRKAVSESSDDQFDDADDEPVKPSRKRIKSGRKSAAIPSWLIAGGAGAILVAVVMGVFLFLKGSSGENAAPLEVVSAPGSLQVPAVPAGESGSPAAAVAVGNAKAATAAISQAAIESAGAPWVKYAPKAGSYHSYGITLTSEVSGMREISSITCGYTTNAKKPNAKFSIRNENEEATGTGFVVGSNGLLVTCAHVVEAAKDIQVTIGGKTYSGTVLGTQQGSDLAVLKIDAENLPALPLDYLDSSFPGATLQVVGFPLTSVLGQGVKTTQGQFSGYVHRDELRLMQTDATINPGNSGGPVFNKRGQVVGVASSKLAGPNVSQVGFCIPALTVLGFLRNRGIVLARQEAGEEMDPAALFQKVSPSVAFIKVTAGQTIQPDIGFQYTATISTRHETKTGSPVIERQVNLPDSDSGELTISNRGEPVDLSQGAFAPILMSRLPLMPLIKLPESQQTSWSNQRDITIMTQSQTSGQFGFNTSRMEALFPNQRPRLVGVQKAMETDQFKVVEETPAQLSLSRTYELATVDGSEPKMQISGTGDWIFDRELGMPVKSTLEGTYKVTVNGVTMTIPYSLTMKRATQEELDEGERNYQKYVGKPREAPKSAANLTIDVERGGFKDMQASPDGRHFAVSTREKLLICRFEDGAIVDTREPKLLQDPGVVKFSPDGKYLLQGHYDGVIRIWKIQPDGKLAGAESFVGHSHDIFAIHVLPDNETVVSSDHRDRVRVWTLSDQKEKYSVPDLSGPVVAIGTDAKQEDCFLVDERGNASIFKLSEGKILKTQRVMQTYSRNQLFSKDCTHLFISRGDQISVFELGSKSPPLEFKPKESINAFCVSDATGELFLSMDHAVEIYDWKNDRRTAVLPCGKVDSNGGFTISPDARFVAVSNDLTPSQILIFDRQNLKPAEESDTKETDSMDSR